MSVTPIIPGTPIVENQEQVHVAPVIPLGALTKLNLDPDVILENNKGRFGGFVIAGWDKDGKELFVSTYGDGGTALWLLERCKSALLGT